jgi:hypothetical protein
MTYSLDKECTLRLKVGESLVRLRHRRPTPAETIEALIQKIPRGDENQDAQRILMTNLDLGRACITGLGDGDLDLDGGPLNTSPDAEGYDQDWREQVAERFPLLLIALGQHLTRLPEYMEEPGLKKS